MMHFFRFTLFTTLGLFLTACGGTKDSTKSDVQSATNTSTIAVSIGDDKRIKVNETLVIEVQKVEKTEEVSSYLWQYQGNTLATTRSFTYTPTELGVNVLDFSVLYNDGTKVSDKVNIIVTSQEINVTIPSISEELKSEYLIAVNNARTKPQECGEKGAFPATTTLTWNKKLYRAAYEHMQDLIESQTFAHEGSGGESDWTGYLLGKKSDLIERAESHNYDWHRLGENLGGGTNIMTGKEMVQAWLDSDNHCENLMNPNFTEVGMVMIKKEGSLYTHYWGQAFGTPK